MDVKSSFILQFMKTFAWDSHWFFLKYLVAFTSEVNWSQCLPHGNFQWFSSCVFQRTWHWHIYVCTWMCSLQFGSVAQSCLTLRPHGLQHARLPCPSPTPRVYPTHVHWVGDAIQPSHLLSSPSPPAFNLSQHQGLFKWVSSLHQVAKVLEFQLQHQSFQSTPRTDWISLQSKGLSRVQKHQFFGVQPSVWSNSHIHTQLLEKSQLWLYGSLLAK